MSCQDLSEDILDAAITVRQCHIHVTGTLFFALHAFYGAVYESLDGFYDRFAERARAEGEKATQFQLTVIVPKGDCVGEARDAMIALLNAAKQARSEADDTTAAMIDELVEALDKFIWQLDASTD